MDKKILICGSIVAVVILVLVSFTSVVGYQTTKSSGRISPLFSVRTKRAIDEEQDTLTCDYIGMNKKIDILIPTRDNKKALMLKAIDRIIRMDDETLDKLIDKLPRQLQGNDFDFNDITSSEYYTLCNWRFGCIAESIVRFIIGTIGVFCIVTTIVTILIFQEYYPLFTIF